MNGARMGFVLGVVVVSIPASAAAEEGVPAPPTVQESGLFGPVRAGPVIGVSAPDGLGIGVVARYGRFGMGVSAGYLPSVSIPGLDAEIARASVGTDLRFYPFSGAFFIGVAVAYARLKGSAERSVRAYRQNQAAVGSVSASGGWVGPELGFSWSIPFSSRPGAPRLSLGTDIGLVFPFGTTEPRFAVSKYGLTSDIEGAGALADTVRFVLSRPTPTMNILRVGVLL